MPQPISAPTLLTNQERTKPLAWLEERFGLPRTLFDNYVLYRPDNRDIVLLSHMDAPRAPATLLSMGMTLLRMHMKIPKPTTEAAMTFGHYATKHVVRIDHQQATAFIHGQSFALSLEQAQLCTSKGYVLVRYLANTLGVGFFHPAKDGGTVRSLFPKAWGGVQVKHVAIPNETEM